MTKNGTKQVEWSDDSVIVSQKPVEQPLHWFMAVYSNVPLRGELAVKWPVQKFVACFLKVRATI